jgi:hypothetical protein
VQVPPVLRPLGLFSLAGKVQTRGGIKRQGTRFTNSFLVSLARTLYSNFVSLSHNYSGIRTDAFVYSDCNNLAISNFAQLIWRIAFPPAGLPRGGFQVRRELSFSRPQEARRPRVPLPRRRRQLSRRARRSKDDRSSSAVPRGRRGNKDGMSVFPLTT